MNIIIKNYLTIIETATDLEHILQQLEFNSEKIPEFVEAIPITKSKGRSFLYKKIDRGYVILTGSLPSILAKLTSYKIVYNKPGLVKGSPSPKLRQYQIDIVKTIINTKRLIVKSPTGSGKSWVIAEVCRLLDKNIVVVVPFIDLSSQIRETIKSYTGEEVGYIGNSTCNWQRITVAIPNSLVKVPEIQAQVLICDEIHTLGNKTGLVILSKFLNLEYSIGFSATPNIDEFRIIEGIAGPIRVNISEKDLIEDSFILKPNIFFVKYKTPKINPRLANADLSRSWTIREMSLYSKLYNEVIVKNQNRNNCVVDIVYNYLEDNTNGVVLILVKRVGNNSGLSHALILRDLMLAKGINFPILQGSTKSKIRSSLIEDLKSEKIRGVIASDKIVGCGIDIPNISCVVMANGGAQEKDFIQMVGRGLRVDKLGRSPQVWDFIDEINIFANHSAKRQSYSESIYGNYEIKDMT